MKKLKQINWIFNATPPPHSSSTPHPILFHFVIFSPVRVLLTLINVFLVFVNLLHLLPSKYRVKIVNYFLFCTSIPREFLTAIRCLLKDTVEIKCNSLNTYLLAFDCLIAHFHMIVSAQHIDGLN